MTWGSMSPQASKGWPFHYHHTDIFLTDAAVCWIAFRLHLLVDNNKCRCCGVDFFLLAMYVLQASQPLWWWLSLAARTNEMRNMRSTCKYHNFVIFGLRYFKFSSLYSTCYQQPRPVVLWFASNDKVTVPSHGCYFLEALPTGAPTPLHACTYTQDLHYCTQYRNSKPLSFSLIDYSGECSCRWWF